jgi:hypothetical protein
MSLWQLHACIEGFSKANGGDTERPLSGEEVAELSELLDQKPVWER